MSVNLNVQGLRDLDKALNKLDLKTRGNIMRRALTAGATPIVAEARRLAPADKGNLRKGINKKLRRAKGANDFVSSIDIGFRAEVFYGQFLELGTRFMAARPMLRPAMDAAKHKAIAAFKKKMREGIERGR